MSTTQKLSIKSASCGNGACNLKALATCHMPHAAASLKLQQQCQQNEKMEP